MQTCPCRFRTRGDVRQCTMMTDERPLRDVPLAGVPYHRVAFVGDDVRRDPSQHSWGTLHDLRWSLHVARWRADLVPSTLLQRFVDNPTHECKSRRAAFDRVWSRRERNAPSDEVVGGVDGFTRRVKAALANREARAIKRTPERSGQRRVGLERRLARNGGRTGSGRDRSPPRLRVVFSLALEDGRRAQSGGAI